MSDKFKNRDKFEEVFGIRISDGMSGCQGIECPEDKVNKCDVCPFNGFWDNEYLDPKKSRLEKMAMFLRKSNLLDWQWFDSKNMVGDVLHTIYDADGITIDICHHWRYLEIFGLTEEEYIKFRDEISTYKLNKLF